MSLAAIWTIDILSIPNKKESSIVTSNEFNSIINSLKNIYNDGINIGINQLNPQETLDVNGDITVSGISNKDGTYSSLGCSTLGTNNDGKLECHSSYAWVYSAWSSCSKSCGGGSRSRTAVCKRDDGETVGNSYCSGTPSLSTTCNTNCCTQNCSRKVKDYIWCTYSRFGSSGYKCSGCASNNRCNNGTGTCKDWWVCKTEIYKACTCTKTSDSVCK